MYKSYLYAFSVLIIILHIVSAQEVKFSFPKELVVPKGETVPDAYKTLFRGVKYGYWPLSDAQLDYLVNNPRDPEVQMMFSIVEYLKTDVKLDFVAITKEQTEQLSNVITTLCEVVNIEFDNDGFKSDFLAVGKIQNIKLKFTFCDSTNLTINTDLPVDGSTNYSKKPKRHFKKIMKIEEEYDPTFQREITKTEVIFSNESEIKQALDSKSERYPLEGIYEFFSKEGDASWGTIKLAIIETTKSKDSDYHLIYLKGNTIDWLEGELKATVHKTLSPSDFKLRYYTSNRSLVDGSLTLLQNAIKIYVGRESAKYIKVY